MKKETKAFNKNIEGAKNKNVNSNFENRQKRIKIIGHRKG